MRRLLLLASIPFLACLFTPTDLSAQLQYLFLQGTGTQATGTFTGLGFAHTVGTQWGTTFASSSVGIGFSFEFEGTTHTTARVYHNGAVVLGGGTIPSPTGYDLNGTGQPVLAPFWDAMRISDGEGGQCTGSSVDYGTIGTAPNRTFVVTWRNMGLGQSGPLGFQDATFQLRLHETTNRIEFYYEELDGSYPSCSQWVGNTAHQTSAAIGIANGTEYLSVAPSGSSTVSSTRETSVDVSRTAISGGTVYTFCPGGVTGNPASGGTAAAADGDTLLVGEEVVLSSSADFMPIEVKNTCATNVSYTITGANAAEYAISSSNPGPLGLLTEIPTVRFSPAGIGVRSATLTLRDNLGLVTRTYYLRGEGVPRIKWIGNIAQGGTPTVANGDLFFDGFKVENNTSVDYTPLTIEVANSPGPVAPVTYSLDDRSGGTFSIDRTAENVAPGSSSSVVITVAPVATVGPQKAKLTVNAEGEVRTFDLEVFSSGAGALFTINGAPLGAGSSIFRNVYECVGDGRSSVEIEIESIGDEPFEITSDANYLTETEIRQGTPPYPVLRDRFGNLVVSPDYFISDANGNRLTLPAVVAPGNKSIIYLTFSPIRPGSRRARAFFESNGENFFGLDTDNNTAEGVLNFELVGQGLGSKLSNPGRDGLPDAVVFDDTKVRETSVMTGMIFNAGDCDMTIDGSAFRIVSGDVAEFELMGDIYGVGTNTNGFVVTPGDTAMFDVSFTPSRSGSRVASVRVVTNDSAHFQNGVAERGTFYVDLFGKGAVGLEGRDIFISPAVIDGPSSTGIATLENNSGGLVIVDGISILGSTEIQEDPANMWPAVPFTVEPGKSVDIGLALIPDAGSTPGTRTGTLEVSLANGDVLVLDISGIAGTRTLNVIPQTLFTGVDVPVGELARRFVAINNNGTLPVQIADVQIAGAAAADYNVGPLARNVVQPGGTDFLEVTYEPTATGMSDATLEIVTNSTNGTPVGTAAGSHIVTLGATGVTTLREDDPTGDPAVRPNEAEHGWSARTESGVALWQSTPNPTAANVEIRFFTPSSQKLTIDLFNANGAQVATLLDDVVEGEGEVSADLSDLPSGRYFYILRTAEGPLTLAIDLVR